jgi:serine/threonine-protein kinase
MKLCPTCKLRYPTEATHCFVDRTALILAPDPYLGSVIAGRYRVEEVIGSGGMSTVYRAMGNSGDRPVAVKVFRKELVGDAKLRERFRRESTNTRRLAHRNVIEILEEGDLDDGVPYLVMEYLHGATLEVVLKRAGGPLPIERAVDLMLQLAAGLARAHDFQVLHRDLKPENLYICPLPDGGELLKILDFGIARCLLDTRLTGTGEIFGTPQYMAPERITTTEAGIPADLYALGCIMFRCVTGQLPFSAKDVTSYLIQHLREAPPNPRALNPAVPPDLEALILQCLEKDPARRPVDAHAIERALTMLGTRHPRPRRASGSFVAPTPPARSLPPAASASLHGMFATDSASRWGRRSEILSQMLSRAFPNGTDPELTTAFGRLRATVTMMSDVHARWLLEQHRLDQLAGVAKEAQGRFGRAMDALGQDLSQARQRAQTALAQATAAEAALKARGEPFQRAHAAVVALGAGAAPTVEVADRYRAAMAALEALLPRAEELRRAQEEGRLGDEEVKDLEFQIDALRSQLERVSQASEAETAEVQPRVERLASQLAEMEGVLVRAASELTTALRGRQELAALFRELESDAA